MTGTPCKPEPGDYERRVKELAPDLGMVRATARASLDLKEARTERGRPHVLYTDADKDRPDVICDGNGQVVLDLCKVCGKAEADLLEHPTCPGTDGVMVDAGWLPISSVPKDGREVILREGSRVGAACWITWPEQRGFNGEVSEDAGEGWTFGYDGDEWRAPDAWQPMPPARGVTEGIPGAQLPDFAAYWKERYEWDGQRGYRYGRDALEQVKFGYEIARAALIESSRAHGVPACVIHLTRDPATGEVLATDPPGVMGTLKEGS